MIVYGTGGRCFLEDDNLEGYRVVARQGSQLFEGRLRRQLASSTPVASIDKTCILQSYPYGYSGRWASTASCSEAFRCSSKDPSCSGGSAALRLAISGHADMPSRIPQGRAL